MKTTHMVPQPKAKIYDMTFVYTENICIHFWYMPQNMLNMLVKMLFWALNVIKHSPALW